LGNIGTGCTVFKYVSLQHRCPKLLIKLGTDFEVGQKWKTVPFRFTFGMNNLEMIPSGVSVRLCEADRGNGVQVIDTGAFQISVSNVGSSGMKAMRV
jgi:hypothetical protein